MTDRELLELAAKAAGLRVWPGQWPQDEMLFAAPADASEVATGVEWNPLASDGDALRLAVKLGLHVVTSGARVMQAIDYQGMHYGEAACADDRCAATRRAIVMAAAQIGKEQSK